MGACLSCLIPSGDEETEERRSLLVNGNMYSDEDLQKELAKQQQRQNELNAIVNDLNDNLIDVTTFLTNGSAGANPLLPGDYLSTSIHDDEAYPRIASAGLEDPERQYPYLLTVAEKQRILQQAASKQKRSFVCESPLFVTF